MREDFSVKVINGLDLSARIAREGEAFASGNNGNTFFLWSGENTGGGMPAGGNPPISPLFAVYVNSIVLSSSLEIYASLAIGQRMTNSAIIGNSELYFFTLNFKGTVVIPFNGLLKQDMQRPEMRILEVVKQSNTTHIATAINGSSRLSTSKERIPGINGFYSYVITITNNTGADVSGTTTVVDVLPEGLDFVSAGGSGFTINHADRKITATITEAIAVGLSKSFSVDVAVTENFYSGTAILGTIVSNDVDYDAKAIIWHGTSISFGTGISEYTDSETYQIRNFIRDVQGIQTRVINKSIGGASSVDMERLRKFDNRFDFMDPVSGYFFEEMINDAIQSIDQSITIENMKQAYNHLRRSNPEAPFIVLAGYPTQDPATEARIQSLHLAMQAVVAAMRAVDPNIFYIAGTRNAWNAEVNTVLYTTDGVHLNTAGRALVVPIITDAIISQNIKFLS